MKKFLDERYRNTYFDWKFHQISENFIKKRTVPLFLIVAVFAVFLYYCSFLFSKSECLVSLSSVVINLLGMEYLNDEFVKVAIKTIISSLTIVISLLSAIYVFTYREQKSVSPSASTDNQKNKMVTAVICSMIFNIVFGWLTVSEYNRLLNEKGYITSLIITKSLYSKIILLFASLILLVYLVVKLIKYLYRTMSVENMLVDSVDQTAKSFEELLYTYRAKEFDKLLTERYRKLHFNFESVFQNLKFAAEHNMNKEFEENIEAFKKKVIDVMKDKENTYDTNVYLYLFDNDKVKFTNLYNSALRSNLALVSTLMKNQRYNKAKEIVSLYFYFCIHQHPNLGKIFKISINDLLDFIDTNDERQLRILLDGMKEIPKEETLIVYRFLMMKMVNKNQLKNLTNLVYEFKSDNDEQQMNKNSVIVILVQLLIKSIEISDYQISGFLVKFLVTNFVGKDLYKALLMLKRKRSRFSSVLEKGEVIEGISENGVSAIKINDETFDYCYKKAMILLHGQHVYSIRQKMWFTVNRKETGKEIKLSNEFANCPYSEYIMNKTKASSSKYGLLFFEDESIMKQIHNTLNLGHLISKKVQAKPLPETISLLISKLFKV